MEIKEENQATRKDIKLVDRTASYKGQVMGGWRRVPSEEVFGEKYDWQIWLTFNRRESRRFGVERGARDAVIAAVIEEIACKQAHAELSGYEENYRRTCEELEKNYQAARARGDEKLPPRTPLGVAMALKKRYSVRNYAIMKRLYQGFSAAELPAIIRLERKRKIKTEAEIK